LKSDYILPHTLTGERQRLDLMSELLDPLHRRLLEKLGLRPGWRCLEVGCGNGSISRWMAGKVGPNGSVVASDIDLKYVKNLRKPNLEVRQLDILKEKPEPGRYDLVTARAILHHIETPAKAIAHMTQALKPGGVLLCIEPDFLSATVATPESLGDFWEAWLQWSRSVGINYFIGRTMPRLLTAAGLDCVNAEGTTAIYPGDSSWAKYWLDTIKELRPQLLESGHMTRPMLTRFNRAYADPRHWTSAITFVGSWGKKPGGR
jgi:2-polyprenyl-3-methyl-5-hydroxy-6-metoxy-1,4-benzoquinol methylase